jgi:hypothetical protein
VTVINVLFLSAKLNLRMRSLNRLFLTILSTGKLFLLTKNLEGNATLEDGASKASYGLLWELLPAFEFILTHFETLEEQAKAGNFNNHPGI